MATDLKGTQSRECAQGAAVRLQRESRNMSKTPMYPLRFEPIYQYRLWGGRRLSELLTAPLPGDGPIGEAWLLSLPDRFDIYYGMADNRIGFIRASGRSKLTREPKQIDAQLGKQTGAELSALFGRRCLVPPSGLCRPVWISRMTKPAEDRVAGEFNPAGRLTGPCDKFFN